MFSRLHSRQTQGGRRRSNRAFQRPAIALQRLEPKLLLSGVPLETDIVEYQLPMLESDARFQHIVLQLTPDEIELSLYHASNFSSQPANLKDQQRFPISSVLRIVGHEGLDTGNTIIVDAQGSQIASVNTLLHLRGSSKSDLIQAGGWRGPVLIEGGAGNDRLEAASSESTLRGGDGDDTLEAALNDVLLGEAGDDTFTIYSGAGAITVDGGPGVDKLRLEEWTRAILSDTTAVNFIEGKLYNRRNATITETHRLSRVESAIFTADFFVHPSFDLPRHSIDASGFSGSVTIEGSKASGR